MLLQVPADMSLHTDRVLVSLTTDPYNNYDGFRWCSMILILILSCTCRMNFKTSGAPSSTTDPVTTSSSQTSSDTAAPTDDATTHSPTQPPEKSCGKPVITPDWPMTRNMSRVINGEEAVPHSWPWQVTQSCTHPVLHDIVDQYPGGGQWSLLRRITLVS